MANDEHGQDGTPVMAQSADNSNTGRVRPPEVGRNEPTTGRVESDSECPTGRIVNDSLESDWHERVTEPTTGRVRT